MVSYCRFGHLMLCSRHQHELTKEKKTKLRLGSHRKLPTILPSVENYANAMEPVYIYLLHNSQVLDDEFARQKHTERRRKNAIYQMKTMEIEKQKIGIKSTRIRVVFAERERDRALVSAFYAMYNFWYKVNSMSSWNIMHTDDHKLIVFHLSIIRWKFLFGT